MGKDTVAPVLSVTERDIQYTEGEDVQVLLQGVSAIDDVDGDVTESIRVRSIHYSDDSNNAIVIYVAKDSSNNIAAVNRKVNIQRTEPDHGNPTTEGNTEDGNRQDEENK